MNPSDKLDLANVTGLASIDEPSCQALYAELYKAGVIPGSSYTTDLIVWATISFVVGMIIGFFLLYLLNRGVYT